jgi:GH15 family glucan-1,4-alpha-glucosidase
MIWHAASEPAPAPLDPGWAIAHTERYWDDRASSCRFAGRWREAVMRSLITLKALTFAPTGAITAAPTTSQPEWPGGGRNWDYRMCWLRDATFTLLSLLDAGFEGEAVAWRDWLMRVVAGRPSELQIMYGLRSERGSPSSSSTGCPATAPPHPCGWATPRRDSSSSTSAAR